ncbi:MAG: hypothetical protein WCH46_00700 [bacterium]
MVILIVLLAVVFIAWSIYNNKKESAALLEKEKTTAYFKDHPEEKVENDYHLTYRFGKYLTGHPDINTSQLADIRVARDRIEVISSDGDYGENILATIPILQVKSSKVEDRSTVESRITATRLVALGVFAFAAKKTEKHPDYYLVIEWSDGKFDFETIFEYFIPEANELANTVSNAIIRRCREQSQ